MLTFGLHRGSGVVAKAIQWQTRSVYSHISLVLPSGVLLEAREGQGVVNKRLLSDVQKHEKVDIATLEVPNSGAGIAFGMSQLGKGYDYLDVFRFLTRQQEKREDNGVWFCSELAFVIALKAGVRLQQNIEPWAVSPGIFGMSPLLKITFA